LKKLSLIWLLGLAFAACHQPQNGAIIKKKHWANYKKAYGFLNTHTDSAFYYFNRAALDTADKLQVALAYYDMALIQADAGDDYGAQESLTLSLKSLDAHQAQNRQYLATDYNKLGMTFSNLKEYAQALVYYKMALQNTADPQLRSYFLNNEGNAYKDLKDYDKALANYSAVVGIVGKTGSAYARVLANIAVAKWLQNPHYNAAPELLKSLAIRIQEKDRWGQNSSYGHLMELYTKSKHDSALWYGQKMLKIAESLPSPDDELYALQNLALLARPEDAKKYFLRYQTLNDSIETKRNAAKNQFAVIRYNVEKARTENLELQKKNTERRYQLIAVLAAAGLAAILGIWLYRKRRQRLQSEAEKEIRESRLQLSQKVHDQVANGIYSIMSEVEHSQELDKTSLIDKLDNVYEVSRNIAHDEPRADDDFSKRINALLNAFKKPAIRLAVSGNEPELWQRVSKDAKQQLELILQELMVNMSKHSQATLAHIGFVIEEDCLKIECRDNGVGMTNPDQSGKGLQNTVSRIKRLNGRVTFDTQAATGFCIFIHLPLALS
jgi:signal transduction histidine kinase